VSKMPECEICLKKVRRVYECEICGSLFCKDCGSPSYKLCIDCLEVEEEMKQKEDYKEEKYPR